MTRSFRAICTAFTMSSLLSLGLSGQAVRRLAQQSPNDNAREILAGSVSRRVAMVERLGALPGDTALNGLSLVLKPTDAQDAALTQLLVNQQNPSNPNYHNWLTPQQFGEQFGLAEQDLAVLRSWLERSGLRVDEVAASRNSIRFSGAATDVAAAFGTTFDQYRNGGQSFHENSDAVRLPKAFAAVIQGVSGLSSYRLTPQNVRMSAQQLATGSSSTGSKGWASPQYTTANTSGTVALSGSLGFPTDLRHQYAN